jgi:glutamyl-tRNA reductase
VQLVVVGISHNTASVSRREALTVPAGALPGVLAELRESVSEVLVLSTCNRVELYALCGHETSGADILRQFLATRAGLPLRTVRDATYAYGHQAAVRHLLRVAAGLDSMVVGESEILGQVRRALAAARQAGTLGPVLERLGDAAVACGKRARATTALGDGESVASVAIRLAARERGGLDGANVVVLGAGETAKSAVSHLGKVPNVRVTVINRTHERAVELASVHQAATRPWDELPDALATADVVVGCTGAHTPVVDAAILASARGLESGPLVCIDLGLPRDIDPAVSSIPGVRLVDLERVGVESAVRRADRSRDLGQAESIVEQETERYMEWWRGRGVASTIARLHARADAIREAELERALARLPGLDSHSRAVVRDLATRMAAKLLHEPTRALKRDPEGVNMAVVVERLFALDGATDFTSARCGPEDRAAEMSIVQESNVA